MKYEELIILIPCHSLEDFPLYHEGKDADSLLASWTAMWHPALLASAAAAPTWYRADSPPDQLENRLVVAPTVSLSTLPTGFLQRAEDAGAIVVRGKHLRSEIAAEALEPLEAGSGSTQSGPTESRRVDDELVADFFALGYCYLQVQLLTRQMRYASNLDEAYFRGRVVAAAEAAMQGDEKTARERLAACFDVLAAERDHYYPVDVFLLDINLVADNTMGSALADTVRGTTPVNLLLSGGALATMQQHEPETLRRLQQAVSEGRAAIIGGEAVERTLPLLSCESILAELRRGLEVYRSHLGKRPVVYGRRRFGLSPALPQILHKLGFLGALHVSLDRGRVPEGTQVKTRWEGTDGTAIDALARTPLDAAVPETFLKLAVKLGESMDSDHVATICLAHWPGHVSPWYHDLRRVARYTSALGKFVDVETYFQTTESPGHHDRFAADQYRTPHLSLAVERRQADPLSTPMRYWRRRAAWEAAQAMHLLACVISGDGTPLSSDLPGEIDALAESDETGGAALDRRLDEALQQAQRRLVDCLPRRKEAGEPGYLILNPLARVRRIGLELPQLNRLPSLERPVYAAAHTSESKVVVADVPAMGFTWIGPGTSKATREKRPATVMAEECLLRNDLFEVLINATTGGLQSIHEYRARGNRISQQLAYRFGSSAKGRRPDADESDEPSEYSTMAADAVETTIATEAMGEIVARGRLLDGEDQTLATFRQTYRLWRGSRVLLIDMELEPKQEPRHEAWNSYYAARFAWSDEAASLWRGVHQTRQAAESKRFEAPHYIEIESTPELPAVVERFRGTPATQRTTILTGGLPFHRRSDDRMLDCLLIVRGERQRKFRLGVGIDLTHPIHDAVQLLAPDTFSFENAPPATGDSGWLLHIDARNVVATSWEPLIEQGSVTGFRVRLLEAEGRPARFTLSCFRDLASARQLDFQGQPLAECQVAEGKVQLEMSAGEWTEVEARW